MPPRIGAGQCRLVVQIRPSPLDNRPAPRQLPPMNPDLDRLRSVARKEPAIAALLDLLRRGRVRGNCTALRALAARYGEDTAGNTRFETLLTACRLLENCGMGQLLQPTRAHRARFIWAVHPHVVRDAVANEAIVLQPQHYLKGAPPPDAAPAPPRKGWHRHTFPLRPSDPITLELPEDLSEQEAKRLGHFLLALATSK